jgi:hypothetical protein
MAALAVPREVGVDDLPKQGKWLGVGASGTVYEVDGDATKIMKVVNVPRYRTKVKGKMVDDETKIKQDQDDLASEVAIQKELFAKVPGSCPAVYDFLHVSPEQVKDPKVAQRYVIVMENCDGKAYDLLKANPGNDDMVLDLLEQIATILEKAQRELKFNHRDLHLGNAMYKTVGDTKKFLLIDFGFACAEIDGTEVRTVPPQLPVYDAKKKKKECLRTSRDLAMLVYRTRTAKDIVLSDTMKAFTQELLTFDLKGLAPGQKCDMTVMFKGCLPRFAGTENREYTFLDEDDVENPNTIPGPLLDLIKAYRENPQAAFAQLKANREKQPVQGSSRTRRTRRRKRTTRKFKKSTR